MLKWEYKEVRRSRLMAEFVDYIDNQKIKDALRFRDVITELGINGWELVAVSDFHYIFKRPLP